MLEAEQCLDPEDTNVAEVLLALAADAIAAAFEALGGTVPEYRGVKGTEEHCLPVLERLGSGQPEHGVPRPTLH